MCEQVGLYIYICLLGLFCTIFLLFVLSYSKVFALFYLIVYLILSLSLSCLFSNERSKAVALYGTGGGK